MRIKIPNLRPYFSYERNWERELLDGKNPQKKIMRWDFEGPIESFDFSKWLPWNYDR